MKKDAMPTELLFGAAYYAEYLPCAYEEAALKARIDTDFTLMREAGMNVIRIAESTWSTWEPEDGVYDFTLLHAMLDGAVRHDLKVIVGTPTYAIPAWLERKHPDIMAETAQGRFRYGRRQLFDLTNLHYRFYAERIIRRLLPEVRDCPAVIGYQLDNETRAAGAASKATQARFVAWLRKRYPEIRELDRAFGLDYWSNRLASWDDFPDVRGTINGSLSAAYQRFLREVITEFLHWQARIVREYARDDQFLTHNFDYGWTTHSYGLQPLVDQPAAAACLDIAGCDIYHPSQERLTGAEIALGGDIARSLRREGYLVLETQAQGQTDWLPYPGQLRQQAYSHLASGALGVQYWHWHSIHNAIESYWKGVLSHDLTPGRVYCEAAVLGAELRSLGARVGGLSKDNEIALLLDTASLVGLKEFPIDAECTPEQPAALDYNDIVRLFYDALYEMNLECDIVYAGTDLSRYRLLLVPALYSASEETLRALDDYVMKGGHLLLGFRSAFADPELKIYSDAQPHGLTECIGASYDEFTHPSEGCALHFLDAEGITEDTAAVFPVSHWMELLRPAGAEVWARYEHHAWGDCAAITHHAYGKGTATYLGCASVKAAMKLLYRRLCAVADIPLPSLAFPLIQRRGVNRQGERLCYVFNYSGEEQSFSSSRDTVDLLTQARYPAGDTISLPAWGLCCLAPANNAP